MPMIIVIVSALAVASIAVWGVLTFPETNFASVATHSDVSSEQVATPAVEIDGNLIKVLIAGSNSERIKGLSGRTSMPEDTGMLFLFDKTDRHGIWMKDMFFSIDILWLDEQKKIVHIEKNVSPETFPKAFVPEVPSRYVLELNSGVVDKFEINVGQTAKFRL